MKILSNQAQEKCFTVEQPRDTPLVFDFELVDPSHVIGFDLFYGTQPLSELRIKHQVLDTAKGEIEYTTDNDGFFCYCVHQISSDVNQPTRLRLRLKYGFDNNHYAKLVKEKNFDAVNLEVHKLNDFLTMTLNEADFQKHKEVEYHAQTEKMNNAALWWPIVQVFIFIYLFIIIMAIIY